MPKGVEHTHFLPRYALTWLMPTSVMPKGVEHATFTRKIILDYLMPTSVMPKGVEHMSDATCVTELMDAHLCDAERR